MMGRLTFRRLLCASLTFVCLTGAAAAADEESYESLAEALKEGGYRVDLLYRFEHVSDDGFAEDGTASTLRAALRYRSARFYGWRATVQFEHVTDAGADERHANLGAGSLNNGVTGRPVIADPEITEIDQAYLDYRIDEGTAVAAGRQTVALGNQRYFGPVGWRQNHQSFDAFRLDLGAIPRTRVTYLFLADANRVNGGRWDQQSHVLDVAVSVGDYGTLTPFYYLQDFDDQRAGASASTRTLGVRWSAKPEAGGWRLPYHLEWASQADAGDNPDSLDADYVRATFGADRGKIRLQIGYELLGGRASDGKFETPQATLHAFNGWADRFLRTPDNGLRDVWATVGGEWAARRVKASVTWHDFGADSAGPDHGSELDAMVGWTAPWGQSFNAKVAVYSADALDVLEDVTKAWFWTAYSF